MKHLIGSLFVAMCLGRITFAAEMPISCQQYIETVEQLVVQSKDERRNQVLMESIATIQETLQMLNEKTAEMEISGENVPQADLMVNDMNKKILKRLSHTCDVMYRQIPSDLIEDLRTH